MGSIYYLPCQYHATSKISNVGLAKHGEFPGVRNRTGSVLKADTHNVKKLKKKDNF